MAYDILARNNEWMRTARDGNGNGILEFGSSDVGQGLYKGTKLAAKDESFMDNSPIHDEARWNAESRTLDSEDVGLNCLVCLDCEMLAPYRRARSGRDDEAKRMTRDARVNCAARSGTHFWDSERKIFANRLWSGEFVKSLAPTSFYPLLCDAASQEQKKHLLRASRRSEDFRRRLSACPRCRATIRPSPTMSIGAAASGRSSTGWSGTG